MPKSNSKPNTTKPAKPPFSGTKLLGSGIAQKGANTIKSSQKRRHDRLKNI